MCSDGLSDMLDDETCSQLLQATRTAADAGTAQALIDAANERRRQG
jgi:serine/threonine protein phosphatase PrpC